MHGDWVWMAPLRRMAKKGRGSEDKIVHKVDNGYRLCVQADLNEWVENRARVDITGAFGVAGENGN